MTSGSLQLSVEWGRGNFVPERMEIVDKTLLCHDGWWCVQLLSRCTWSLLLNGRLTGVDFSSVEKSFWTSTCTDTNCRWVAYKAGRPRSKWKLLTTNRSGLILHAAMEPNNALLNISTERCHLTNEIILIYIIIANLTDNVYFRPDCL